MFGKAFFASPRRYCASLSPWKRNLTIFIGLSVCTVGFTLTRLLQVEAEGPKPKIEGLLCLNPAITHENFAQNQMPDDWEIIQAHVHQRHMDRWIYRHDLIENRCWKDQADSSHPLMVKECGYPLSSVWEQIEFTPDPYASPKDGACKEKQLTIQGINNSRKLGEALRREYILKKKLVDPSCPLNSIGLESDYAQKNQITTQEEYFGLCGRLPDVKEFPRSQVIDDGTIAEGRPFWLTLKICNTPRLKSYLEESEEAMHNSEYWNKDVKTVAEELSAFTGHPPIPQHKEVEFLDNIIDCTVCHYCHPMGDVPRQFYENKTLWNRIDRLETKERGYPFQYFASTPNSDEFRSLYFGYYFKVLHDRMEAKINDEGGRQLYIQVTSDAVLTPQLNMLGVDKASQRPPWGSTLVYELYRNKSNRNKHAVRVLFNGETLPVCGKNEYCDWEEFSTKLTKFVPEKQDCSQFYSHYPQPNL